MLMKSEKSIEYCLYSPLVSAGELDQANYDKDESISFKVEIDEGYRGRGKKGC